MALGIVGLGEVGAVFAQALRRNVEQIRCFDTRGRDATRQRAHQFGVLLDSDPRVFAASVDLVLIAVQGRHADQVAGLLVPRLRPGTVYADATSKSLAVRDCVAQRCHAAGLPFLDVAIMDTVSWADRPVELIASGAATERLESLCAGTRLQVRVVNRQRPASAELKLLRSVFTKGLTALLIETLTAAERCAARAEIQRTLSKFMQEDFERIAEMLLGSSIKHARRRADEMADVLQLVSRTLSHAPMTQGAAQILRGIAELGAARSPDAATLEAVVRQLDAQDLFGRLKNLPEADSGGQVP